MLGKNTTIRVIVIEKPEGQRPPERCKCRWEDNVKVNLTKWGMRRVWAGFTWLDQWSVPANTVPIGICKMWYLMSSWVTVGFSGTIMLHGFNWLVMPNILRTSMTQEFWLYMIDINTLPLQDMVTVLLVRKDVIYKILYIASIYFLWSLFSVINLVGSGVNIYFLTFLFLHEDLLCAKVFRNNYGIAGLRPNILV